MKKLIKSILLLTVVASIFPFYIGKINQNVVVLAAEPAVKSGIDYSVWSLQTPDGDTSNNSAALVSRAYNDWWYAGKDDYSGYDMFQTPALGKGTSNYVRTELRERLPISGGNANWGKYGYHRMTMEVKADIINSPSSPTSNAGRNYTSIGQVWGETGSASDKSAMFELFYGNRSPSFSYRRPELDGGNTNIPGTNVPMGKDFKVEYIVSEGKLSVYLESSSASIARTKILSNLELSEPNSNSYYFKAGNYDQSSKVDDSTPNPADVHSLVGFKSITVEHNPIKGRLTYAGGNPIANQEVSYTLNGGGVNNLTQTVTTDNDGYYYIANIPSNGGVTTAGVVINAPSIAGSAADKNNITVPATNVNAITDIRSGSAYNFVYSGATGAIESVGVSPNTVSVARGSTQTFIGTVNGTGAIDTNVNWSITGNNSAGTTINNGLLTVGLDETATSITVKATSVGDNTKFVTATVAITKADGETIVAPTLNKKTASTITINPVAAPSNGQVVEYAISTTVDAPTDDAAWQTTLTFNDLTPDTNYYIFARAKSNEIYNTGIVTQYLMVKTNAKSVGGNVLIPILASSTRTTITINPVTPPTNGQEVEYAINTTSTTPTGNVWQSGLTFEGLIPNTDYYIFARAKSNGDYNAGTAEYLETKTTIKDLGATVSAPTLNSKTKTSITINAITAPSNGQTVEYAIATNATAPTNAEVWQTTLEFTDLEPDTTYYVFARSKENDTYFNGVASKFEVKTNSDTAGTEIPVLPISIGAGVLAGLIAIVLGLKKIRKKH